MIGPFRVEWTPGALDGWRRLSLANAATVARAVQNFAETGEGTVICLEGEYRLFAGAHLVEMLIDGETIYVMQVRRS